MGRGRGNRGGGAEGTAGARGGREWSGGILGGARAALRAKSTNEGAPPAARLVSLRPVPTRAAPTSTRASPRPVPTSHP